MAHHEVKNTAVTKQTVQNDFHHHLPPQNLSI